MCIIYYEPILYYYVLLFIVHVILNFSVPIIIQLINPKILLVIRYFI